MINAFSLAPMEFTLKRLVFVNSAKHAYSELLLDQHLAMFGRNNNGKTASLAATKLLLFPETNFKHCYSKFGFEGKDGPYSSEQSFQFYFPTAKSFIALEVQNPTQCFTMVLYRASISDKNQTYAYHRVFIPVPYAALRHLFWDEANEDFAEALGIAALTKFCKAQHGEAVSDGTRLRQLMFARLGSADAQYCIVPLKDNSKDSITAFSSIYNLAFAMSNTVSDVLPLAIASLIEMQRGRDEERLDSSLEDTYQSFLRLQDQQRELQLKANMQPGFEKLAQAFATLAGNCQRYSQSYHQLGNTARQRLAALEPEKHACCSERQALKTQLDQLSTEISALKQQQQVAQTTIDTRLLDQNKYQAQIKQAEQIILEYPTDLSEAEIIAAIQADSEQKTEELALIVDADKRQTELKKYTGLHDDCQQKIHSLQAYLLKLQSEDQQQLLAKQLSEHSKLVLYSLNPLLHQVAYPLDANSQQHIENFSALFTASDGQLLFQGVNTGIAAQVCSAEQALSTTQAELATLQRSQQHYLDQIRKIQKTIRDAGNQALIQQTKTQLSDALLQNQKDIALLNALATHQANLAEAAQQISAQQQILQSCQAALSLKQPEKTALQSALDAQHSIFERLSEQSEKYSEALELLDKANSFYPLLPVAQFSAQQLQSLSLTADSLKKQAVELLTLISKDLSAGHDKFQQQFSRFATEIPLQGIDSDRESYALHELAAYIALYQSMFDHLAFEQRQFNNAVLSHNEAIRAQVNEIKESRKQLNRAISTINQKLNQYQVSNLSEIRLHLETIEAFDALDHSLEQHVFSSDVLPDEAFYTSLMDFFNKYQVRGRLKMAQLIKSINYRYKIDNVEVSKSQSGGTTTTITAFVLSVLLNEIKVADTLVRIPIIVDEISALDAENAATTIKQIAAYGFSIFCATPEFTGYLVNEVGRYIYINQHRAKSYMDPECQWNIMPQHMNYWGAHEIQS